MEPFRVQMRAMGLKPIGPPREDASRMDVLGKLWAGAGLENVETREITVHRTFADFETCWKTTLLGASVGPMVANMTAGEREQFKEGVRAQGSADANGRITLAGRANAIKGRVPK